MWAESEGIGMDETLRIAMELFPKLTHEERIIVHDLIVALRQSQEHAADPEEEAAETE